MKQWHGAADLKAHQGSNRLCRNKCSFLNSVSQCGLSGPCFDRSSQLHEPQKSSTCTSQDPSKLPGARLPKVSTSQGNPWKPGVYYSACPGSWELHVFQSLSPHLSFLLSSSPSNAHSPSMTHTHPQASLLTGQGQGKGSRMPFSSLFGGTTGSLKFQYQWVIGRFPLLSIKGSSSWSGNSSPFKLATSATYISY